MKMFSTFGFLCARYGALLLFVLQAGASPVRGDVVFAWNELLLDLTTRSADLVAPHLEVRRFAMAHLAIHDAVASAAEIGRTKDGLLSAQRAAIAASAQAV